jgi:anti-sigma factor RsiW
MLNCEDIEPALAGYVDGHSDAAERARVEKHLSACPPCRGRAARERTAHDLLCARRTDLRGKAPAALRQRCAALRQAPATMTAPVRRPWVPLSMAATLAFASMIVVLFGVGGSVETYAAQLAADHIKCFQYPPTARNLDPDRLGEIWQGNYGWPLRVAPGADSEELELLGIRRCASTRGRVAHMLYRWRGEPLSVYVLNSRIDEAADASLGDDAHDLVKRFGEQEIIWTRGERTYAVVARAPVPELQKVAHYVRRRVQ